MRRSIANEWMTLDGREKMGRGSFSPMVLA